MSSPVSLEEFYREINVEIPQNIRKEIGHFNIFNIEDVIARAKATKGNEMPYNKRMYYKISLVRGHNISEYADKVIEIKKNALLFATPKIPYNWVPQDDNQSGHFCVFTPEFLAGAQSMMNLDKLPIFKPSGYPVFQLDDKSADEISALFQKMNRELSGDYQYKYDLIRNYLIELFHYGQKLQPLEPIDVNKNASARVSSVFIELLERQFPIESPQQRIGLRSAGEFADRLAVHVNHLNKVLKEVTGKTTSHIIKGRILQEAKILLKDTNWTVSEIAFSLGFDEVAHFSNYFKRETSFSPIAFRG